jgi:hypothetical protein
MTTPDDLARVALEAFATASVRSEALSVFQARQLLGIQSRYEIDGLLKKHGVFFKLTLEDIQGFGRGAQSVAIMT